MTPDLPPVVQVPDLHGAGSTTAARPAGRREDSDEADAARPRSGRQQGEASDG